MQVGDWINLGTSITTLAAAAIAFIALWFQVRNLSTQLTLQNFSEYTRRYADVTHGFPEDINAKDFVMKSRPDYDSVMRCMRLYYDLCFEEWSLNRLKFLDSRIWLIWNEGMKVAFRKSAFRQGWTIILEASNYGEDFEQFVVDARKT